MKPTNFAALNRVRSDFDLIASLDGSDSGDRGYDQCIISLIPDEANDILEVGCGTVCYPGNSSGTIAGVLGIDVSSEMIRRAGQADSPRLEFKCAEFVEAVLHGPRERPTHMEHIRSGRGAYHP